MYKKEWSIFYIEFVKCFFLILIIKVNLKEFFLSREFIEVGKFFWIFRFLVELSDFFIGILFFWVLGLVKWMVYFLFMKW